MTTLEEDEEEADKKSTCRMRMIIVAIVNYFRTEGQERGLSITMGRKSQL